MNKAMIAVITYKRPLWLKRLLDHLITQKLKANMSVSILVVDNGCDVEIENMVKLLNTVSNINIKYATEATLGIVSARNKCVEIFLNSDCRNLLFIDDDEWPVSDSWVQTMLERKEFYSADIVTSHVLSVGEPGAPEWAVNLIYGNNHYNDGDLVKIFYTNNLLISRNVVENIRPAFDLRFEKTGASDYHFALKCYYRGFKAVYVDAPVKEEFPKSRATIMWFLKRGFRSGVGYTRSHLYEESFFLSITKITFMSIVRIIRGIIYVIIGCLSIRKLKIVDGVFRLSSGAGTIFGLFGIKHNEYVSIHGR